MINKREIIRKFKNNKVGILIISVIVLCVVYLGVQKAIDSYAFKNNSDIVDAEVEDNEIKDSKETNNEEPIENKSWFERLFGGDDEEVDEKALTDEALAEEGKSIDGEQHESLDSEDSEELTQQEISKEKDEENGKIDEEVDVDEVDLVLGEGDEPNENGDDAQEKIYVFITGEVNVPGVVILNKGSRIVDAINAAGGTTNRANVSKVNLVFVLEDGMKVNIPNNNDLKNNPNFEYITMNSGDGANDNMSSGSSGGSSNGEASTSNSGSRYSIVNINTATQTELETLPGIGPSLALKIINYRKENGKFSTIEEIKNVSGIGESKFENLKDYIMV